MYELFVAMAIYRKHINTKLMEHTLLLCLSSGCTIGSIVVRFRRTENIGHNRIQCFLVMFTERHTESTTQHHQVPRKNQAKELVLKVFRQQRLGVLEYL